MSRRRTARLHRCTDGHTTGDDRCRRVIWHAASEIFMAPSSMATPTMPPSQ
ncbi:hypothetical protein GH877_30645 [Bacillus thuringiensis]|nr:hypothetical protein [Bacillus thuringiensis]